MEGVLTGFVTIGAVIGVGFLLAQLGILECSSSECSPGSPSSSPAQR